MTCVCDGQCGRHKGPCPERSGYASVLKMTRDKLAVVIPRTDGQQWCSFCWRKHIELRRQHKDAERAATEKRQEKLF